jgi:hypothetical protein
MAFGWEVSAGWQWLVWAFLMAFFCFGFGTIFWGLIPGLDRYEEAWWNRKPVVWALLGLLVVYSLGTALSHSILYFIFRHPVVPKDLAHLIKTTMPDNRVLIVGDRVAEQFMFSYFILFSYLSFPRSTKRKEWTSDHFVHCLVGITLLVWGVQILAAYHLYLSRGSAILGFDLWDAIFNFKDGVR